jgi:4-amino-4-deoxy-L-arabinose transferase-like glycosyltransferase
MASRFSTSALRDRWAQHLKRFNGVLLVILLLALLLRLQELTRLPIFHDEALYLHWAQQTAKKHDLGIALGEVSVSTFQVWLLAGLYNLAPSALWLGRFVSATAGFLTTTLCYAIARQIYARKDVAAVAALLYALLPLAVFHDRLAQNDGLLTLFLAIFLWQSISWVRHGGILGAIILIVSFGLAFLTKRSAALWIPVPILAVIILGNRARLKTLSLHLLGLMTGFLLIAGLVVWLARNSVSQIAQQTLFLRPNDLLSLWYTNTTLVGEWFYRYLTGGGIWVLLVSLINAAWRRERHTLLLAIIAVLPTTIFTAISVRWYPRYLAPISVPVVLLMAEGIVLLNNWGAELCVRLVKSKRVSALLVGIVGSAVLLPMMLFAGSLATDPTTVALPAIDRWQYVSGWPAGYGLPEAAAYLASIATPTTPIYVWCNSRSIPPRYGLRHYLPKSDFLSYRTFNTATDSWTEIEHEFDEAARQRAVYIVLNLPYEKGVPELATLPRLRRVIAFPKPGGESEIAIYRWLLPGEESQF